MDRRSCKTLTLIILSSWIFMPGVAFAESQTSMGLLLPSLNFLTFFAIATWLFRSKIKPILVARAKEIEDDIELSFTLLKEAEQRLNDIKKQLDESSKLREEVIEKLKRDGQLLASQIEQQSIDSVKRIERETKRRIKSLYEDGRLAVRTSIVKAAVQRARERFQSGLDEKNDKKLRRNAIETLKMGTS